MSNSSYIQILDSNSKNMKSFLTDLKGMNSSFIEFLNEQTASANTSFEFFDNKETLIEDIAKQLNAISIRWERLNYHLESYWNIVEKIQYDILQNYNKETIVSLTDNQSECAIIFMENFLYNARSYVDYVLRLICTITERKKVPTKLNTKKVYKILKKSNAGLIVLNYLDESVFGNNKWGYWLRIFRDKVAHSTILSPNTVNSKVLDFTFEWQSLRNIPVQKQLQDMCNGCYELTYFLYTEVLNVSWRNR